MIGRTLSHCEIYTQWQFIGPETEQELRIQGMPHIEGRDGSVHRHRDPSRRAVAHLVSHLRRRVTNRLERPAAT